MKIKRTVGTGKIFLYSCGLIIAFAAAVWLIVNGAYAVYIACEEPSRGWRIAFGQKSVDIVTPWLLAAAAAAVYYRYCKICGANNLSLTKQTGTFALMSIFIPTAFAAADLLSAKLVYEKLCGNIVCTRFEDSKTYFFKLIFNYVYSLDEDVTVKSSPYTMQIMLLLFALMAVYYYCCFLAGAYIMQCIRCGRKKTLIYYLISVSAIFWGTYSFSDIEAELLIFLIMAALIVSMLTNPAVFLYILPMILAGEEGTFPIDFLVMSAFILITAASIYTLGLKQFPSRRHIKKILKKGMRKNDGQT